MCGLIAIVALERPVNGSNGSSGAKSQLSPKLDKGLEQIKHKGSGSVKTAELVVDTFVPNRPKN